eukprot:574171-Amphidinium_carterae.1
MTAQLGLLKILVCATVGRASASPKPKLPPRFIPIAKVAFFCTIHEPVSYTHLTLPTILLV